MNKRIIANRFGLIALMSLSLFASTAFAGNAPAATPVIITNTPAQPVPMVGLVKDSDAPARKPFQTAPMYIPAQLAATFYDVLTIPANQRLVIEHVSGTCANITGLSLASYNQVPTWTGVVFLARDFYAGAGAVGSTPVRLYANAGETLKIDITNQTGLSGYCYLAISGYFVNLP